tara:strand:+ start:239 stop:475 length:237 start_codon:yes stop_codon:yes gene_type:complete
MSQEVPQTLLKVLIKQAHLLGTVSTLANILFPAHLSVRGRGLMEEIHFVLMYVEGALQLLLVSISLYAVKQVLRGIKR